MNRLSQRGFVIGIEIFALHNLFADFRVAGFDKAEKAGLKGANLFDGHVIQKAVGRRVNHHHLMINPHRLVLRLFQKFGHALAAFQLVARGLVEIGAELGERREFAELGEVEF